MPLQQTTNCEPTMASIPEARTAFNLKVLRRHDPSIVTILETASFVVLYNYNNGEWTKTVLKAPCSCFDDDCLLTMDFFLMNRNGVENFSADITPEDDLEITPDSLSIDQRGRMMRCMGFGFFEQGQRNKVGEGLLELQKMDEAPGKEDVERAERASRQAVAVAAAGSAVAGESKGAAAAAGAENGAEGKKGNKANKANGKGKKGQKGKKGSNHANNNNNDDTDAEREVPSSSVDSELSSQSQSQQINLDDLFGSIAAAPAPAAQAPNAEQRK